MPPRRGITGKENRVHIFAGFVDYPLANTKRTDGRSAAILGGIRGRKCPEFGATAGGARPPSSAEPQGGILRATDSPGAAKRRVGEKNSSPFSTAYGLNAYYSKVAVTP